MRQPEHRAFALTLVAVGVALCALGGVLFASGLRGLVAGLLVLFGFIAVVQALFAWLGFYRPRGAREDFQGGRDL